MTITSDAQTLTQRWDEPAGINPRGTLVVLTGRGETPEVYQRFGARLAADAYRVVALSAAPTSQQDTTGGFDDALLPALRAILADPATVAPVVLVGSDTGAQQALHAATLSPEDLSGTVSAVIVAGLPTAAPHPALDWADEIAVRTACPNHQAVLGRSARGGLWSNAAVVTLDVPAGRSPSVPVLAIHGSVDTISPLPRALEVLSTLPSVETHVVDGGLHDILNDVTHRSVAATIVLFLERLRLDPTAPVIVRSVRSTVTGDNR